MTGRKTARVSPSPTAIPPAGAESLREQLGRLSADQLAEIVERFLAGLSDKQRLEFMNLLPSTRPADLESKLPHDDDTELLEAIKEFCDRVRSGEYVQYGAGYDPQEREYQRAAPRGRRSSPV
jgi:hypothetical protein